MNCKSPVGFVLVALLLCALPVYAQRGGGGRGGGHGFGGHGFGGHSGSGGSTSIGHSVGHSLGHSFGHFFGRRSGGRGSGSPVGRMGVAVPPSAGASMIRGRVVQLPGSQRILMDRRRGFHRRPITEFGFPHHSGFFAFGSSSFNGFCDRPFGFGFRRIFFSDFDCFQQGFLFDPFFVAGFDPFALGTAEADAPFTAMDLGESAADAPTQNAQPGDEDSLVSNDGQLNENQAPAAPDTFLQLTNGSMYALKSYWLEGDRIRYITSYGGENSIPISQIDFGKTIELNAAQGVKFELRPKPVAARP